MCGQNVSEATGAARWADEALVSVVPDLAPVQGMEVLVDPRLLVRSPFLLIVGYMEEDPRLALAQRRSLRTRNGVYPVQVQVVGLLQPNVVLGPPGEPARDVS